MSACRRCVLLAAATAEALDVAARHWPLARFSLESIRGNDGPRGDCQRHCEEHRYRSKVTNIPRSSDRSRQPQNKQRCQPGACAYDIENHLYARPGKEETRDRYGAQTDHVARDDNGEDVVDQYLSLAGGAVAMSAIRSSHRTARTPRRRGPSTPPPPVSFHTRSFQWSQ